MIDYLIVRFSNRLAYVPGSTARVNFVYEMLCLPRSSPNTCTLVRPLFGCVGILTLIGSLRSFLGCVHTDCLVLRTSCKFLLEQYCIGTGDPMQVYIHLLKK